MIVLLWSSLCTETKASKLYHVYIDDVSGNDSTECLNSNSTLKPCKTLSYVAKNLNWTKAAVTVLSDCLNLTLPVEFKHLQQLVISGNHSTILCSETNAGLAFVGVENLSIHSFSIEGCGAERNSTSVDLKKNQTENVSVAVYILNCTGVAIHDVDISLSNGRGLSIYDTNGTVNITNCVFSDNVNKSCQGGGGGLHIEFTYCSPGTVSNCNDRRGIYGSAYNITNCIFANNIAYICTEKETTISPSNPLSVPRFGKGGGLYLSLGSSAARNTFFIKNCTFQNNSATSVGGGMIAEFLNSVVNTTISVSDTRFIENHCVQNLECNAGLVVAFIFYNQTRLPGKVPFNNDFSCTSCMFDRNRGGGLIIFASKDTCPCNYGTIGFKNSNWTNNMFFMGAAVLMNPAVWDFIHKGCLPTPKFTNCRFENNTTLQSKLPYIKGVNIRMTSPGYGIMLINEFDVFFEGNLTFGHNKGTAVHISNGILEFSEGSTVNFLENTAQKAGAIAMYGASVLQVSNNSVFNFIGNKASLIGGAIYVEFNVVFLSEYHNCFIRSRLQECSKSNATFLFEGNHAGVSGSSIFATTFKACAFLCQINSSNTMPETILQQIADFTFNDSSPIATLPTHFKLNTSSVEMIPGIEYHLPLVVKDESQARLTGLVYEAWVNSNQNASIDPAFQQVSHNTIVMLGAPNDTTDLHLHASGSDMILSLNVTFANCQPGYIFNESKCVCGAADYLGLVGCDPGVKIRHGYWIGFCSDTTQTKLCTTFCPPGFCSYHHMSPCEDLHPLPYNASLLDSYICGPTRTGRLCGKCVQNHSVYFHSESYQCGEERLCHLGWFFYLISEVVPLVFIFIVITCLNISFTDGNVNCFVLYAQVLDFLPIDVHGAIESNRFIEVIHSMLRFIHHFFNLNFFTVEQLSFCLWKGATVLDVMTMKATTVGLALVLVLLTLLLARCRCAPFRMLFTRLKTPQSVLIHGLSAFIVLCYSQCAQLVFHILTFACLYSTTLNCEAKALYSVGYMNYFEGAHIKYAVVAMLALIFLIIIPPLLLLLYPLVFKCLGLCKQSESKISAFLWRLMPIQILDAFQSSFKDRYRFFAGLYFLYRAIILAAYAYSGTVFGFYSAVQLLLVLVLTFHAIIQPYKNRKHNIIDVLLFTNLTVINAITLFNYTRKDYMALYLTQLLTTTMRFIQAFLISLPFLYIIISGGMRWVQKKRKERSVGCDDLPPLRSGEHTFLLSK